MRTPLGGHPLGEDSPCTDAEAWADALSAAHPDGFSLDARLMPGYSPPSPLVTGDGASSPGTLPR